MPSNRLIFSVVSASALALSMASPAHAGKADRARQAIAAAQAKIDAAATTGAGIEVPHQLADAKATLARARENLASHHKPEAIDAAIEAQALADAALGEVQKHKQQAALVQQQVAQDQAAIAQQQAAQANARADAAQQSAAISAQQAADARIAAASAAQTKPPAPASVETTVTTQTAASTPRVTHHTRVVKKRAARHHVAASTAARVTTTTTVRTPR
ncbi:hypothetical protein OLX02_08330 [Novosphingobium sp. KCTC 2891]|uniref:hypothetical protein n=1 Tax=Novosphingobium sp. KCTC 2891 TaxID=2989730 RepID=UPI002222C712|nr:hypothetical protein [Novosphingobium sp. KCTC 2891]MCW1382829.1 hypothetical protein [Novosphingobium sp. KCTC 2891]